MSKKKQELALVEPQVTALGAPEVMSQIDMKLSKGDLIELVIEEKKESLELQIKAATEAKIAANEEVIVFRKKTAKEVEARFIKKQAKLINAFKSAFPQNSLGKNTSLFNGDEKVSFAYVERAELSLKPRERKVRNNPLSHKRYREDREAVPAMVDPVLLTDVHIRIRSSCGNELSLGDNNVTESDALSKASIAVVKKQEDALRLEESLKAELTSLSKSTGRVRADLTRSILAKSTDGAQLLGMLEGLKKSIR